MGDPPPPPPVCRRAAACASPQARLAIGCLRGFSLSGARRARKLTNTCTGSKLCEEAEWGGLASPSDEPRQTRWGLRKSASSPSFETLATMFVKFLHLGAPFRTKSRTTPRRASGWDSVTPPWTSYKGHPRQKSPDPLCPPLPLARPCAVGPPKVLCRAYHCAWAFRERAMPHLPRRFGWTGDMPCVASRVFS